MNNRFKDLLAEVDRKGWVALAPMQASVFEGAVLRNALEVEPGQSLLHYLSLERFKTMIGNGGIFMRRLDLFQGDPHEGRFPAANAQAQSPLAQGLNIQLGLAPDALNKQRDFIEGTMRELTYVHCWFGWDREDERMWDEYGDKGRGVCIRTTARRLKESLSLPEDLSADVHGVTYSGDEHPVPEIISFLAACRKRPQFAHEREIRLLGQLGEKTWQACYTEKGLTTPDHQMVVADFGRLFERVYVGPNASPAVFEEVEALANSAAGSRVVQRSTLPPFPAPNPA